MGLKAKLFSVGGGGTGGPGSQIIIGAGVPSNALGVDGDIYIDSVAPNNFYKKITGAFVLQGSLQGLPGADGVDGTDGIDGAPGPQGPPGIQTLNMYQTIV